jgi:hypothetical protein
MTLFNFFHGPLIAKGQRFCIDLSAWVANLIVLHGFYKNYFFPFHYYGSRRIAFAFTYEFFQRESNRTKAFVFFVWNDRPPVAQRVRLRLLGIFYRTDI